MLPNVETALIGCVVYGKFAGEVFAQVDADEFHDATYKRLYEECRDAWTEKGEISVSTLIGLPEELMKAGYIASQTMASPQPQQFIDALKERNALERSQIIAARLMTADSMDELRELSDELMRALQSTKTLAVMTMSDGVKYFMETKETPRKYIRTGYSRLDGYTFMDKGDYVVLGARPSSGKTALALNLAVNFAKQGLNVGFFSLETSNEKAFDRIVSSLAEIPLERIKRQSLNPEDWSAFADAGGRMVKLPLTIIPAAGKTVSWIQSESLRLALDIVIIDYLGLIKSAGRDLREMVTRTSRDLHVFAQSCKKLVIALCQLNRAGDGREPRLIDLREAGEIEENADAVLLIDNPPSESQYRDAKLIVAKNKDGIAGIADNMTFEGAIQRFTERSAE